MSAQHSNADFNPAPEPGAREAQQSAELSAVERQKAFANAHLPIDPQQQFREYTSPGRGAASTSPVYPPPGYYQPGNAGQSLSVPGYYQPGNAGQPLSVPGYYQPSNAGQPLGVPGYYQPGNPPYATYPGQVPGQQMPFYAGYAYPGYPGYGYAWPTVPARPRRDTYLLVVSIIAFACSCLVILGGLGSLGLIGLVNLSSASSAFSGDTYFSGVILLLTLAAAGLVGGGFCMYHSIRSLFLRKTSRFIWLPRFWIFLLCYLVTLGFAFWLNTQGLDNNAPVLVAVLIYLGAIFPALAIMALGIRRLSFPKSNQPLFSEGRLTLARMFRRQNSSAAVAWPTSWRRLTLALVSGATLSIVLASILELILGLILYGLQSTTILQSLDNTNSNNFSPSLYGPLLVLLAVIAPLVEEMVKPLAVVVLIGRVRSKAEAFTLGLACGIGFNLVETTGYISQSYNDWLSVALVRSGAGLLHGFGAAMVALGWYYLTHKEEGTWLRRIALALGCAGYAVLQHAAWNGSVGLIFLSGPVGAFFQNWSWNSGPVSLDGTELVNIGEVIAILIFFIYMTGRLRARSVVKKEEKAADSPLVAPA